MSRFSLQNYMADAESKSPDSDLPAWLAKASEKIRTAYFISLREETQIKEEILSGAELTAKERKVVPSKIAQEVGVDRSYFAKSKQPDLYSHFQRINENLQSYYLHHKPNSFKASDDSKESLKRKCNRYRRLYQEERDKNISTLISGILNSELYGEHKLLAQKCAEYQQENRELNETIANLRSRLRALTVKGVK